MKDVYGAIRVVIKQNDEIVHDAFVPSGHQKIAHIGKDMRMLGHHINVSFCFEPPLIFEGREEEDD